MERRWERRNKLSIMQDEEKLKSALRLHDKKQFLDPTVSASDGNITRKVRNNIWQKVLNTFNEGRSYQWDLYNLKCLFFRMMMASSSDEADNISEGTYNLKLVQANNILLSKFYSKESL